MTKIQDEKAEEFVKILNERRLKLNIDSNFSSKSEQIKYNLETVKIQNEFYAHLSAVANKSSIQIVKSEISKKVKMEELKRYDVNAQFKEQQALYNSYREEYEDLKTKMNCNVENKKNTRIILDKLYNFKKAIKAGDLEAIKEFNKYVDEVLAQPVAEQKEVVTE